MHIKEEGPGQIIAGKLPEMNLIKTIRHGGGGDGSKEAGRRGGGEGRQGGRKGKIRTIYIGTWLMRGAH